MVAENDCVLSVHRQARSATAAYSINLRNKTRNWQIFNNGLLTGTIVYTSTPQSIGNAGRKKHPSRKHSRHRISEPKVGSIKLLTALLGRGNPRSLSAYVCGRPASPSRREEGREDRLLKSREQYFLQSHFCFLCTKGS